MNPSELFKALIQVLIIVFGLSALGGFIKSLPDPGVRQAALIVLLIIGVFLVNSMKKWRSIIWPTNAPGTPELPPGGGAESIGAQADGYAWIKRPLVVVLISVAITAFPWIVTFAVYDAVRVNLGDTSKLFRDAVLLNGGLAGLFILILPSRDLVSFKWVDVLRDKNIRTILLVTAIGWWLVPAIGLRMLTGEVDSREYVSVVFPITYVLFPLGALVLRVYRGR